MVAGPGGAMIDEVGVIISDLTVRTTCRGDGMVGIAVQCNDVDEWYTLQGSPTAVPDGHLEGYHHHVLKCR
ncbi:hypothetical protein P3T37_000346 [Kitasatospora sp. MAA4]|uniref:hypothetical protein n=1 Tax=Kitasatospora sp. MAA4 TaxID=3035093 RepID=UPI00247615DD|nr:hypothetical protein [Kitasatospora sp. MAA4]MDH6130979.1 hypothetical protein [Kitasatospora sp. MAA4]